MAIKSNSKLAGTKEGKKGWDAALSAIEMFNCSKY